MSAAVIAFPVRSAPAKRPCRQNPYAFLTTEAVLSWRKAQERQDKLDAVRDLMRSSEPATKPAEDEILKLLRRIDRRLAKQSKADNQQYP